MNRSQMRRPWIARASATLCLVGLLASPATAAEPVGIWKLVVLAFGADDFAIVDLHRQDDKPRGVVIDGRKQLLEGAQIEGVDLQDGRAAFTLKGSVMTIKFSGSEAKEGPFAGQIVGTVLIQNESYPASLEKTREEKLAPAKPNAFVQDFLKAARQEDMGKKVDDLRALLAKNPGVPANQIIYSELLGNAEAAKLPPAEVDRLIANWRREAEPFGQVWVDEVGMKAFKAIAGSKPFAETALKLGQELDKGLAADASTDAKAVLVKLLATAARNAGKADLAADAEGRAAKLDAQLDAEYHEKVPPFKPTPYEGRKKPGATQPVVLELFTGAQCPPCVAADVAFDALLKTYKPTDFIGLQYHLHIPGPDPLTNADAVARQGYYGDEVRGTPSTFFNGRSDGAGGGPMAASENKYNEYRGLIDEMLEQSGKTEVALDAKREGEEITIVASANSPTPAAKADAKDVKDAKSSLRLRLALTEESVRYVGGNKLRFHHHVVRALPGGAEGTELVDGKGKVELKVNLVELREKLNTYVSEYAKERPFPAATPEIALKNLSVVAFVQDDLDKAILGAVSVPVAEATP
ncbi:hypothetical protein [Planctomyces sp. SH-PL62]|uniref:hypothetical protein n=1 Tax=Planctomyces sp. SH-PL62 TaxID=1636152 RepID=UPI00078ED430|nr:hypothetical protein [Planctomyces sp. SH-PL62]AMV38740.1 hypothetical protein VT85_14975 [Planctomyces sp. SH-PL62]